MLSSSMQSWEWEPLCHGFTATYLYWPSCHTRHWEMEGWGEERAFKMIHLNTMEEAITILGLTPASPFELCWIMTSPGLTPASPYVLCWIMTSPGLTSAHLLLCWIINPDLTPASPYVPCWIITWLHSNMSFCHCEVLLPVLQSPMVSWIEEEEMSGALQVPKQTIPCYRAKKTTQHQPQWGRHRLIVRTQTAW